MSIKLATLNTNDISSNLEIAINQTEQLGFELITLAKGMVDSKPANVATFRRLSAGTSPATTLTLIQEPAASQLSDQQTDINANESGAKRLISYGVIFVQGVETNVAVYRN